MKEWLSKEWRFLLLLGLTCFAAFFVWGEWKDFKVSTITKPVELRKPEPMQIGAAVTGGTSVAIKPIQQPEQKDTILQIVRRGNKISAVVDGKEQPLALPPGVKDVKLGEDGMLEVVETTQVTIDVTAELNARLAAEREIDRLRYEREKQKALDELNRKKNREKVGTGLIGFAAGYLVGKIK